MKNIIFLILTFFVMVSFNVQSHARGRIPINISRRAPSVGRRLPANRPSVPAKRPGKSLTKTGRHLTRRGRNDLVDKMFDRYPVTSTVGSIALYVFFCWADKQSDEEETNTTQVVTHVTRPVAPIKLQTVNMRNTTPVLLLRGEALIRVRSKNIVLT